jgi:hypothetical protein
MTMKMKVQYSGMDLDKDDQDLVNKLSDKFCKSCKVDALHINIKDHKKAGGRMSYTVQLRAEVPKKKPMALEITDWEFEKALRTAFDKLTKEVSSAQKSFLSRIFRINRAQAEA